MPTVYLSNLIPIDFSEVTDPVLVGFDSEQTANNGVYLVDVSQLTTDEDITTLLTTISETYTSKNEAALLAAKTDLPVTYQGPADESSVIRTSTDVQIDSSKYTWNGTQYEEESESIIVPSADPTYAGAYPADHYNKVQALPTSIATTDTTQDITGTKTFIGDNYIENRLIAAYSGNGMPPSIGGDVTTPFTNGWFVNLYKDGVSVATTDDLNTAFAQALNANVKSTNEQALDGTDDNTFITPLQLRNVLSELSSPNPNWTAASTVVAGTSYTATSDGVVVLTSAGLSILATYTYTINSVVRNWGSGVLASSTSSFSFNVKQGDIYSCTGVGGIFVPLRKFYA